MMGIDQAGQNDMAARIDNRVDRTQRLPAGRDQFGDPVAVDDQTAAGIVGQDGERVLEPDAFRVRHQGSFCRLPEWQWPIHNRFDFCRQTIQVFSNSNQRARFRWQPTKPWAAG
jgi:hypothetical protein